MSWIETAHERSAGSHTAQLELECPWWEQALRQLSAIARLPAGWDSQGSDPPEPQLVDAAKGLLWLLCAAGDLPQPHINPTPSGGVQFEWEHADRYFEMEVTDESAAAWFFQDRSARIEVERELEPGDPLDEAIEFIRRVQGMDGASR